MKEKEVKAGQATVLPKKRRDLLELFRGLEDHNKLIFALLVAAGMVAFWRGLWLLMDLAFFPDYALLSAVFSLLLGLTILAATGVLVRAFVK